ncbi:MAG: hypothetical protein OEW78_05110 [Nitrosopumilus sp.]|uniref:hypothetical protein n=1 Tax=Nitrosopumilus sp. TaxID=2024843 RepID=UPI00246BFC84|nr:hypothetical protein [Nitrosopumilus sp.]MDH5431247.1 hypothetical protein [Nitrosopumilus sp.]
MTIKKTNLKFVVFLSVLILLGIPLTLAYADDDDDAEDVVENLGWVAVGAGIVANVPFIAMNKIRRYALKTGSSTMQVTKQIRTVYKPVLNFHIMLNSIGYFAGMTHGLMLSRHLDSVSLSLAIVMSVMMVSGLLLKYTSSRNSKIFGKLLHGQFGLVMLLASLVILHIVVGDD